MDDILKDSWVNKNDPISKQIRNRIKKAGDRFHCNDNISKHIEHNTATIYYNMRPLGRLIGSLFI